MYTISKLASTPASAPAHNFADEAERMRILESHDPDALEDDPELQAIVNFAARLCGVPTALVTLIEQERQRFLAREGVEQRETPRDVSFCIHAMVRPEIMEVRDATADPRFADNPLVTGDPFVRYYAGHPLVSDEGAPLGALCVIDTKAHEEGLTDFQREGLAVLAQAAMRRLRSQRANIQATLELAQREQHLRTLADSMPAIVFCADAEGRFDYFNRRTLEMLGEGHEDGRAIHPEDKPEVDEAWARSVSTGEPYEVQHRVRFRDGEHRWVIARALPARDQHGKVMRWFGTAVDIDDVHKLSESRDMMARELSHRIKNIFAVVTGLIALHARKAPENKVFADVLVQVLRALGRAHDFVRPASGTTRESLRGLLEVLFAPYDAADGEPRVHVSGADCPISPAAATPLALIFHELATNAAKYGALSADNGHVQLEVADRGEELLLVWTEHGGPQANDQSGGRDTAGFGSRLVEMAVTGQLQGSWERRFEKDGLVVVLSLSKEAVAP